MRFQDGKLLKLLRCCLFFLHKDVLIKKIVDKIFALKIILLLWNQMKAFEFSTKEFPQLSLWNITQICRIFINSTNCKIYHRTKIRKNNLWKEKMLMHINNLIKSNFHYCTHHHFVFFDTIFRFHPYDILELHFRSDLLLNTEIYNITRQLGIATIHHVRKSFIYFFSIRNNKKAKRI